MSGTNKIVKWKLQKTVEELITSGVTTSTAIAAALTAQGHKISQPTVSRYLKEERELRKEETQNIVGDHVRENIPADLTALETMEKQCLDWAGEQNASFAQRLAAKHIREAAPQWIDLILRLNGEEKEKHAAIKSIISQCLSWTADDIKLQSARILAMRQATSIIEMKLRYSIGENNDGKIFFLDSGNGDKLAKDDTGNLMVIRGGIG